MERIQQTTRVISRFTDNTWTILVKVAEVVAGVQLFQCGEVQTVVGVIPVAQILGAILIADVVIFVNRLLENQTVKSKK